MVWLLSKQVEYSINRLTKLNDSFFSHIDHIYLYYCSNNIAAEVPRVRISHLGWLYSYYARYYPVLYVQSI